MNIISLAYRNILRNKRRTIMTIIAISVSTVALLIFGGFVSSVMTNVETGIIMSTGHIHIYKEGYLDYGAGNFTDYGIDNYQNIINIINNSPELSDHIRLTTKLLFFSGIAGNYDAAVSNTFLGIGIEPQAFKKMNQWNYYNIRLTKEELIYELDEDDINLGIIGYGLAKVLRLDDLLVEEDRYKKIKEPQVDEPVNEFNFDGLLDDIDFEGSEDVSGNYISKIDLLASTSGGAPNVVNLFLNKAEKFPVKIHNDNMVITNIKLAQNLIYGQDDKKVTAIVLQLHKTSDINNVVNLLNALFQTHEIDALEIKKFDEIRPEYNQIVNMFVTIFSFVSIIMLMIIIVILLNTMSMSVMERFNEIGTLRSIGLRRTRILKQFVAEGLLLGVIGSAVGVIVSILISYLVNISELTWIPPNYANELLLCIHIFIVPWFLPLISFGIIFVSGISSIVPANKAAQMNIVDALRHN